MAGGAKRAEQCRYRCCVRKNADDGCHENILMHKQLCSRSSRGALPSVRTARRPFVEAACERRRQWPCNGSTRRRPYRPHEGAFDLRGLAGDAGLVIGAALAANLLNYAFHFIVSQTRSRTIRHADH